jgi:hypothetical protein
MSAMRLGTARRKHRLLLRNRRAHRPPRPNSPPMAQICHTAPSLRLFVPNSLTVNHRSFSSEGYACNVLFFSSSGDYSPIATTAPSLRTARPERFTAKVLVDPVVSQSSKGFIPSLSLSPPPPTVGAVTPGVAGAPTVPALLMLMLLVGSSDSKGADPSTQFSF